MSELIPVLLKASRARAAALGCALLAATAIFAAPTIAHAAPTISQAAPTLSQAAPTLSQAAPTLSQAAPILSQAAPPAGAADVAAPAAATRPLAGPQNCPGGYLCFWVHPGWGGPMGKLSGTNGNWSAFRQPACQSGTWNDCASAIWNNGRYCAAVIHEHPNQRGADWVLNRNTGSDNLAFNGKPTGGTWNDVISSNRWWCP